MKGQSCEHSPLRIWFLISVFRHAVQGCLVLWSVNISSVLQCHNTAKICTMSRMRLLNAQCAMAIDCRWCAPSTPIHITCRHSTQNIPAMCEKCSNHSVGVTFLNSFETMCIHCCYSGSVLDNLLAKKKFGMWPRVFPSDVAFSWVMMSQQVVRISTWWVFASKNPGGRDVTWPVKHYEMLHVSHCTISFQFNSNQECAV